MIKYRMNFYLFILCFGITFLFCGKGKAKDSEKDYENYVLFNYFIVLPTKYNSQSVCVESMQKEEICLGNSTNLSTQILPFRTFNEETLSKILSSNKFSTYSSYCEDLLTTAKNSSTFNDYTAYGKECVMDCSMKCSKNNWISKNDNSNCTGTISSQVQSQTSETADCNSDCFIECAKTVSNTMY